MRNVRVSLLALGAISMSFAPALTGCGGSDTQPAMPDPSIVDQSADDMGMPEASEESADGETSGGNEEPPPPAEVTFVAGPRTPIEGDAPRLRITSPRAGQRIARGNVSLRVSLTGWGLQPSPGRHIHVIVDNEPYIAVRDVSAPLDLNALVEANLHHPLAEGTHVVRVFPSRSHHESVKTEGAFASVVFHYRSRTEGFSFDPAAPLLTFSRPKGCNEAGSRVLLDFYVANTELSAEGTRVHYELDGAISGDITSWTPHFIENLPAREHTLQLSLRGADGQLLAGPFNDTTRTFQVAESCQ